MFVWTSRIERHSIGIVESFWLQSTLVTKVNSSAKFNGSRAWSRFFRESRERRLIRIPLIVPPSSRNKTNCEKRIRFFSSPLPFLALLYFASDSSRIDKPLFLEASRVVNARHRQLWTTRWSRIISSLLRFFNFHRSTQFHASSNRIEYVSVRAKRKKRKTRVFAISYCFYSEKFLVEILFRSFYYRSIKPEQRTTLRRRLSFLRKI